MRVWLVLALLAACVAALFVFWPVRDEAPPAGVTWQSLLEEGGPSAATATDNAGEGGFSQSMQPAEEREKQNSLPMSKHPLWDVLKQSPVTYSNEEPHITISNTQAVKDLVGKEVSISGFVLPLDDGQSTARTKHFLLSQRTPTCTYCPPGEPNEVVEVMVPNEIEWVADEVVVTGTFSLVNNTDNGIFYRIDVR